MGMWGLKLMVSKVCIVALVLVLGSGMWIVEGEMILEIADALNLAVLNTWFMKQRRLITYEPGECRTVVDYILSKKSERKMIRDVEVVN